jgi:transposase InsO family protein
VQVELEHTTIRLRTWRRAVPSAGRPIRGQWDDLAGAVARSSAHVRTRHHAPQTNGVVERFNQSLKYEHLYPREIAGVIALNDEIEAYRELYNWVRPLETLGQIRPMTRYLETPVESHLSEAET